MRMLLHIVFIAMAVGLLAFLCVLAAVCASAGMTWTPEPSDCIIVLGAHVWMDGRMSNVLTYRCQAALEAWQAGVAPAIIVCGGQGDNEPEPEGAAMARWFAARGVPQEAIFVDAVSENTVENLKNAMAIMEKQGFRTAAVATTNYHLRRALWLARDLGLPATGIAAPSTKDPASFARGRLRETCSWILYFLRRLKG